MGLRKGLMALAAVSVVAMTQTAGAKTFRWAFQGDVQTMDPHGLFETMTLGFQRNIYEGLVWRNRDMELKPGLATAWENTAPDTWIFKLRQGVKFHNGNDFTADDVLFSVERINTEGSDMKLIAGLIKEARKLDDHTVEIVTPLPNPILPLQFEIFYIMDKEWSEQHGTVAATNVKGGDAGNHANINANGTGPYKVSERQPDQRVTELTDRVQVETDQAKRQALIDEAFQIHLDEVGHIPLHQQPLSWGISEAVEVAQRPDNVFDLRYAVVK